MSPQDKLSWLTDFTDWRNQKLPLLCCAGNAWNSKLVAMFDEGLDLISVFAYTTDFVAKSRLFRDYARRVPRLSYYVDKILREVIATAPAPTITTEAAAPQPRRRGRPTKAESAAMEQQRAEAARAEVAARLIHDPLRAMAEQKPAQPAAQGDLFGPSPAPKAPSSSSSLSAALALSGGKLHIDQLAWLLSADLRERTTHIAELRSVAAAESNQAKELAERDVPEAVIQPHTAAAIKATNEYKAIYAAIDRELGTMYAQLTSGKHTAKYEQLCQSRGITTAQLADILLPYWEKIGSPAATEEASPATPETDEEKKARQLRLHSIRTYFTRKDRIMKPARIAKMRGMIDELRGYGLPTEEYEAMLAKAEEELNVNVDVDDNENENENENS